MEHHEPIGGGLAFGLIAFGVMIDLLQAFLDFLLIGLFLSWAIDFIAFIGFTIMLQHHGGNVLRRRAPSLGIATLFELIPGLNALPVWTGFAIRTVLAERIKAGQMAPPIENHRLPRHGRWRL